MQADEVAGDGGNRRARFRQMVPKTDPRSPLIRETGRATHLGSSGAGRCLTGRGGPGDRCPPRATTSRGAKLYTETMSEETAMTDELDVAWIHDEQFDVAVQLLELNQLR